MGIEFFGLLILLGVVTCGLGMIVFICAMPFLFKPTRRRNRFGALSPTHDFASAAAGGLRHGVDFSGRANPMDFWFFAIFVVGLCGLSYLGAGALVTANPDMPFWLSISPLLIVVLLVLPSLSMAVRRLHDVNRSGWWLLLLGVFGHFVLLYWFCQPTQGDDEAAEVF